MSLIVLGNWSKLLKLDLLSKIIIIRSTVYLLLLLTRTEIPDDVQAVLLEIKVLIMHFK